MDVFDLQAKITLDSSEFESELARSKSGLEGLITKANLFANAITEVGKKAADVFSDVAESIIKVGTGFDTAMANVAAISGASGDSLDALREKAKEMGAETKFSALEAADAFGYMAMAGWKTEDMLAGIDGIMNLAAASGEDLATTSDIVTDALTAFGLTAADSGRFADILAAASSNANTNVSMMGETFKYVAPLAGTLGYSAEDVAVAVGLMANSGIKAGQAGTSLRAALSAMLNPSEKAASLMEDLGISMTDVDGNSLSLSATFDMLREAFSGLSDAEQASAAAILFGQEAMSGMLSVINAAPADIEKLTTAVENAAGSAQPMSAIMQDNVGGAWDEFTSALEGAQIALHETFSDDLQANITGAADGVSRLTAAFEEGGASGAMSEAMAMLSEMTGLDLSGVTESFSGIGQAFSEIKTAFAEGGLEGGLTAIVGQIESLTGLDLSGVTEGISGFAESFSEIGAAFKDGGLEGGLTGIVEAFKDATGIDLTGLVDGIKRFFDAFAGTDSGVFTSIGEAVSALLSAFDAGDLAAVISAVADGVGKFLSVFGTVASDVIAFVAQVIAELARNFKELLPGIVGAATAITTFIVVVKGMEIIGNIPMLLSAAGTAIQGFSTIFGALNAVMAANPIGLVIGLIAGLAAAFATAMATNDAFRDSVVSAFKTVGEVLSGMGEIIGEAVSAVIENFKRLPEQFADMVQTFKEAGRNLIQGLIDGITEKVNAAKQAIVGAAQKVVGWFKDVFDINSPSKVFEKIGEYLMQGMALGIDGEAGTVQSSLNKMRLTVPAISTGKVDFRDSALGKASSAAINGAMAAGASGGGVQTINLMVDGRTLAQVVFDPLNGLIKQKGVAFGA